MVDPVQPFTNLAIVAGAGMLPCLLADQARRQSKNYCIVTLQDMNLPWAGDHPNIKLRPERVGQVLDQLHQRGMRYVVFAGAVKRPARLLPWRFDLKTAVIAGRLLRGLAKGDDGTLRMFLQMVENAGLQMVSVQELMPDLLAHEGVLTRHKPKKQDRLDADFAVQLLRSLSPFDLGQGCVIAKRRCLSIESHYGTDAMLDFIAQHHNAKKRSGVLVKMPKIGQDMRADLPALGVQSVHNVARAGLSGIAMPAGQVLLIERDKMIKAANNAGIFLYSMPAASL